jgi:hypothetical protein
MYDNNNNNVNTTTKYEQQTRAYTVSINKKDGTSKAIGFINIVPTMVKDASLFTKIEQELDKALEAGLVKFGGAFSIEASDKGANNAKTDDFAW